MTEFRAADLPPSTLSRLRELERELAMEAGEAIVLVAYSPEEGEQYDRKDDADARNRH